MSNDPPAEQIGLLLQETIHRGGNDLQMVVSLLSLQSRRATSVETRQALSDTMERVSILARARSELGRNREPSLAIALQQVCTALRSQSEPRSIEIRLDTKSEAVGLSPTQITTVALVVNELATNAIKHGYEEGKAGHILITQSSDPAGGLVVLIDDDGLPFPDEKHPGSDHLGLELSRRLMASIGGVFTPPRPGSKVFELRVPPQAM